MSTPLYLRDGPDSAQITCLFAHGAGAPMDSAFMNEVARGLGAFGHHIVRFEFPYMARLRSEGVKSGPDRMPVLKQCFSDVVSAHRGRGALVLMGKSMGGRVATMIADELEVEGVVALGYPFHPPGKPAQLRTKHLAVLKTRCLIVQGTRDPFGTKDEIPGFTLSSSIEVKLIEDGDHSFVPRKKSGRTEAQNLAEVIGSVHAFLHGLSG